MSLPDRDTVDKYVLRAADIRGVAGLTLTNRSAELIGRAFGTVLIRTGLRKCLVGGDGRLSTPDLSAALIRGLLSCGVEVINIGCCPTPMLYFSVVLTKKAGGVMVTASHNPKEYNGFKLMIDGKSFCADNIQNLGKLIDRRDFEQGKGSVHTEDFSDRYLDRLVRDFRFEGKPLTVVWDCGNGTAGTVAADEASVAAEAEEQPGPPVVEAPRRFAYRPNLLVVDGGQPQVAAAAELPLERRLDGAGRRTGREGEIAPEVGIGDRNGQRQVGLFLQRIFPDSQIAFGDILQQAFAAQAA